MAKTVKYKNPPKETFRRLGLGVEKDGFVKVVAGFADHWWDVLGRYHPVLVNARIIRRKARDAEGTTEAGYVLKERSVH